MKQLLANLFQIYVWLIIYPVAWTLTILVAISVSIFSILGAARFAGRYIAKGWGRIVLWITPAKVKRTGLHHVEPHQSYVVVANHQSTYDILLVYGYLPLDFKWVMKIELRKMPFVGFACEKMGHIYVDRRNRKASILAMQEARDKLVNGTSVFFFPEGTRSNGSDLIPFKKGAFRMARDLQLPILPVSIDGADDIMPKGSVRIMPGTINMTFHEPITVEEINQNTNSEIIKMAEAAVCSWHSLTCSTYNVFMSTIKKILTLIAVLIMLIGAVAISSLNADSVALNLYWYQLSLPLGFMLLLFTSVGLLFGLLLGWLFWTWPASRKKTYWEREYFKLKQQTENLETAPIKESVNPSKEVVKMP